MAGVSHSLTFSKTWNSSDSRRENTFLTPGNFTKTTSSSTFDKSRDTSTGRGRFSDSSGSFSERKRLSSVSSDPCLISNASSTSSLKKTAREIDQDLSEGDVNVHNNNNRLFEGDEEESDTVKVKLDLILMPANLFNCL